MSTENLLDSLLGTKDTKIKKKKKDKAPITEEFEEYYIQVIKVWSFY